MSEGILPVHSKNMKIILFIVAMFAAALGIFNLVLAYKLQVAQIAMGGGVQVGAGVVLAGIVIKAWIREKKRK